MALCAVLLTRAAGVRGAGSTLALALSIAIAGPVWLGYLLDSFAQAVLLTGLGALLIAILSWRLADSSAQAPEALPPIPWVLRIPVAVMAIAVVWAAVGGHFWLESSSHFPVTTAIARGVLPPEHPLFPGEPLRYAYGYDLLAAHVLSATGVPVDVALDAVTIGSIVLLLLGCRDLGRRIAGPWGAGFMMLIAPLGSGALAFLLLNNAGPLQLNWSLLPTEWHSPAPPMVISSFFRHPLGLSMGFAAVTISVFAVDDSKSQRPHLLLGAFLLGVLALINVAMFAVITVALGISLAIREVANRRPRALAAPLGALIAAAVIGYSLGGFFAAGIPSEPVLDWGTGVFPDAGWRLVALHLIMFGLPLVLLPYGIYEAIRTRNVITTTFALAALVSFALPNIATYAIGPSDTLEHFGIAMLFATALLARPLARWAQTGLPGAAVAVALTMLTTGSGALWLARASLLDGRLGIPKLGGPPPNPHAARLGRELEGVVRPHDRILTHDLELGLSGGLLIPGADWRRYATGLAVNRAQSDRFYRIKLRAMRTLDPALLKELQVKWVVMRERDMVHLTREGLLRLRDPRVSQRALDFRSDTWRRSVYRLFPRDDVTFDKGAR